ncbi:MAG TPA: hypothetical protein VF610_03105 [Segetibacter sp.]
MKEEILAFINDPQQLEKLYQTNKAPFKREFNLLYSDIKGTALADFWNERLNYESEDINWGTGSELLLVVIAALIAGVIAKLPAILSLNEEFFYTRNIGFIIFPVLTGYLAWKNNLSTAKIVVIAGLTLAAAIFINLLPNVKNSDTLILSCVHLLLVLWSVAGFAFVGSVQADSGKRLAYLKYNGDLIVITTLIVIAGGILTGLTIGLFSLIGFNIEKFYFENIVIFALPAAPIMGTFLTLTNPQLVGKVSPVIAKIFSPLVLVMLVIYLAAMAFSQKNPYNDRDFLLIFNALLLGVMAIIFFSVAETVTTTKRGGQIWVLALLALVTIIVNCVALSAILFRMSTSGVTPNRAAVFGGNVLILIHLLLVSAQLIRLLTDKVELIAVKKSITNYLPVYCLWAAVVTFLFPFLFGFK